MTVRNLIYGPAFQTISSSFDLTVLSYFTDQLKRSIDSEDQTTIFTDLTNPRWNLPATRGHISALLERWSYHAFWQLHRHNTIEKWIHKKRVEQPISSLGDNLGGLILRAIRRNKEQDWLRDLAYTIPLHRQYVGNYAVFVTSIDLPKDRALIYSCKKFGIPVIALVHSWDNLTNCGLLSSIPDRLLVWNKYMVNHAVNFHNIPSNRVDIVGGPQYELYRNIGNQLDRTTFYTRLKIPEGTPLITYTCNVENVFPDEPEFMEQLISRVAQGVFGEAVIVFRLHPSDPIRSASYLDQFSQHPLVRIDIPDDGFAAENTWKIGAYESIVNFVELMKFSDVVINMVSTITLDAVLFDTPVICPSISLKKSSSSWDPSRYWYTSVHYKPIALSGSVDIPKSLDELTTCIKNAITDPSRKRSERMQLSNSFTPNLPTSELIVESINRILS